MKPKRVCALCSEPLPTYFPRVELRVNTVEPTDLKHFETRHNLVAYSLCEMCGRDIAADLAEKVT